MADDREPTGGSVKRSPSGRRDRRSLLRQGAIAGAAAIGTGLVLKGGGDKSARAADGDPVFLGFPNASTSTTRIDRSGGGNIAAVTVTNDSYDGVQSFANSGSSYAIWGVQSGAGLGVVGNAQSGDGVFGGSQTGNGVTGGSNNGYGVYGYTFGVVVPSGVTGISYGSNSNGVTGEAHNGPGAYGVWGKSNSGFAGFFEGSGAGVWVAGNFTVTGAKSAAVAVADGSLRRLYCMESPESYFEDFGSSALTQGTAQVALEPVFASVVQTEGYQVFLTPEGESQHLYVTDKTATGFTVREAGGGKSGVPFSYRVVAKRRDAVGTRLEPVETPMVKPVTALPEPPLRAVPQRGTSPGR